MVGLAVGQQASTYRKHFGVIGVAPGGGVGTRSAIEDQAGVGVSIVLPPLVFGDVLVQRVGLGVCGMGVRGTSEGWVRAPEDVKDEGRSLPFHEAMGNSVDGGEEVLDLGDVVGEEEDVGQAVYLVENGSRISYVQVGSAHGGEGVFGEFSALVVVDPFDRLKGHDENWQSVW